MRGKSPMKMAVAASAIALLAAGCQSTEEPSGPTGGTLRIYATEPSSLVPGEASDNPSIQVIRQLFAGLTEFDAKTGAAVNNVAESIESTDNLTWTVKLKKTFKFHNGEAVVADSFIDAWNYTAYGPNAAANSHFMEHVAGYADTQAGADPDKDGPEKAPAPKSKTLSGLKKIDENSFTVTLDKAFVGFPAMAGYSGFFPQPKACFADSAMKDGKQVQCKETPIGNGRYKIEGSWKHNVEVKVVRNEDWSGTKGKAASLQYRIYDKNTTAYADFQAEELDIVEGLPPEKYTEAKATYKDSLFEKPSNSFTYVGFPLYDARFANPKIRQALSLAIDRQQIIDKVFQGRFSTATGIVSPNFEGYRDNACEFCKFDPAKAKTLLAEAGGWTGGKLVLWANAGASHESWLAPLGDQLKANLGIDYELKVDLQFPQYLATGDTKKFTGLFRLGWGPDYAVLETYLAPLYGTGGSSNYFGYSNKEFDDLVNKGNSAKSIADAIKSYQAAEDIIVKDLPMIPMWFGKTSIVYRNITELPFNTISGIEYHLVNVTSK